ncbi:hypothetical protein CK501_11375 [Halovibrio salipaludis]|uniref:Uncharacterized protein n=1 Tax=Halovibrio salipaludis TaxID=2032626 RepID=A0A2A2F2X6_9GAMM|nr:hypothetical protein CK501_11375 [Halovibrio salipaludis]
MAQLQESEPEITWQLVLISLGLLALAGLSALYLIPPAYDGLVNDLLRPITSSGRVITVRSFDLALPLLISALLFLLALSVLVLVALPLGLTQRQTSKLFQPFLWLAFIGAISGLLANPVAWGISIYLENTGYHECLDHWQSNRFITTWVFVSQPRLCGEL